jgi:hypothetical protein
MSANVAYFGGIVTEGLVICLDSVKRDSYPGTGTVWNSIARGNQITGNLLNGAFYSRDSGSMQFDGVDDYVNLSSAVTVTSNFTVTLFTNIKAVTGGNILAFYNSASPFNGWGIGFSQPVLGKLYFWDGSSWKDPSITVVDSSWKQIGVVVNSAFLISFYINGLFVNSIQGSTISTFSGNKTLAARNDGAGPMNGNISNLQIYNRALSAQEILQNYNALKGRFGLT